MSSQLSVCSGCHQVSLFPNRLVLHLIIVSRSCSSQNILMAVTETLPQRASYHFKRFHKIPISEYQLRHVSLSVRPHGTTRLPLDGFS